MPTWNLISPDHAVALNLNVTGREDEVMNGTLTYGGRSYSVSGSWAASGSVRGRNASAVALWGFTGKITEGTPYFIAAAGVMTGQGTDPVRLDIRLSVASSSDGTTDSYSGALVSTRSNDIRHVFVLMLENRSFDHLLGGLGMTGFDADTQAPTKVNGIVPNDPNFSNDFGGTKYTVQLGAKDPMDIDPAHEFPDTLEQLCNVTENPFPKGPYPPINNAGFVANYAKRIGLTKPDPKLGDVMACCTKDQVPVLHQLATEFAVCDNWFSSMPGPTMPNRLFAMGASSCGMDRSNGFWDMSDWLTVAGFPYIKGCIFNRPGLTWRGYFDSYWDPPGHAKAGSFPMATFLSGVHSWNFAYMTNFAGALTPSANPPFETAVKDPNFPYQFVWIEPNHGFGGIDPGTGSSQHPRDYLAGGEQLIAKVYNALRNSPIWEKSLLIITWDEHGGFYDHVAPPAAVPPGDGIWTWNGSPMYVEYHFDFSRYGPRVPTVVISPLIKKNTVDHGVYDHTSALRTVEDIFSIQPLTQRDRQARSLLGLLSEVTPRTDCLRSVAANKSTQVPRQPVSRDADPWPSTGVENSVLMAAIKTEMELPKETRTREVSIEQQVEAIKTMGDARAFFEAVIADAAVGGK
ncbi:MAG TPA: alkaline phosphatase family protein [Bryobacteraceae bacterium]|nr:alkaline phosphatase family protein [Bryobacteraceae bacterium]